MVNLTIDGQKVSVESGTTILKAARSVGIDIPTLCNFKDFTPEGSCRMCLVEVVGARRLETSCSTPGSGRYDG